MTLVDSYAFDGCTSLKRISIPVSVTKISSTAFDNCTALTTVYYAGSETQWNAIENVSSNDVLSNADIVFDAIEPEAPATYTVTVDANITNGTVTADKTTAAEGETVTLTIAPATSYELDTLTVKDANNGNVTVTDNKFTMPAKNVTVTATFKEVATYTVAIADTTNGTVTADKENAAEGETVTLTIAPATSYELDTLTVKDADNGNVTVTDNKFTMPAKNVTVTATFKEVATYTVTLGQSELILAKGKSNWITATVSPEATVTWSSGDDSVATVDSSGRVTAAGVGSTTITATVGTVSKSCTVYVYDVSLNPIALEFAVGGSSQELAVTIKVPTGIELSEPPRKTDYSLGAISIDTDYGFTTNTQDGITTQTYTYSVSPVEEYSEFNLAITINMKMSDNSGETGYVTVNCPTTVNSASAPVTYTVTFNSNGGTVTPTSAETETDGKLTYLPTPTRSGYTFNGWFDAQTGGTEVTTDKEYTENTTIYAQWTAQSRPSSGGGVTRYTVKFETNGGTTVSNKTVTRNSKLTEPTAPTKDGYTFEGWYTDKELTKAYNFDTKVTKAITLYAKWTENKVDDTDDKTDDKTDTPDTPVWENPFTDVKADDWYYENVRYAVENGLMGGTTETTFAPNGIITRAMMVTVLYRAEGEPTVTGTTTFEDVDSNAYYAKAVVWGQQNGIIKGYSETEFAPDQNITREQIAAIMHRYAQYKGYDVSVGENTNILSYSDYDSISEYAIASMQYAVGSGLMKGKTTSTLNPLDNATRAEIAAILERFIKTN